MSLTLPNEDRFQMGLEEKNFPNQNSKPCLVCWLEKPSRPGVANNDQEVVLLSVALG